MHQNRKPRLKQRISRQIPPRPNEPADARMTDSTFSLRLLAGELTPRPLVENPDLHRNAPAADAEARQLAAAIARGDEEAFRRLYDRYHRRLLRLGLMLGRGDEWLAQEVTQSVFVTAAAKLRKVQGEEHLWNWLAQVARQQTAKIWRERQKDGVTV